MITIDFSSVQTVKTKNSRKAGARTGGARKQNFNGLVFTVNKKGRKTFTCSSILWDRMNFDSKGFVAGLAGENLVAAFICSHDCEFPDATVYFPVAKKSKTGNKTKTIISDKLENLLLQAGLLNQVTENDFIEAKIVKQYVTLSQEPVNAENLPEGLESVYVFEKDSTVNVSDSDDADDSDDDSEEEEEDFDAEEEEVNQNATATEGASADQDWE